MFLIRNTFGWQKPMGDWIAQKQIALGTGLAKQHADEALDGLGQWKIIVSEGKTRSIKKYRINLNVSEWLSEPPVRKQRAKPKRLNLSPISVTDGLSKAITEIGYSLSPESVTELSPKSVTELSPKSVTDTPNLSPISVNTKESLKERSKERFKERAKERPRARESRDVGEGPEPARESIANETPEPEALLKKNNPVFHVDPEAQFITNQEMIGRQEAKRRELDEQKKRLLKISQRDGVTEVLSPPGKFVGL